MTDLLIGNIKLRIAGLGSLPANAYAPFVVGESDCHAVSGALSVVPVPGSYIPSGSVVATGFNDLGESRLFFDGKQYTIGISPRPDEPMRYMALSPDFRRAALMLAPADPWAGFVIDSMLRIFFSQVAVLESSFLIHASAVVSESGAHLFMGKSGTGKSTHSSLWIRNFKDCSLLNDDNPLVTIGSDGVSTAHGTPWSGKTECWRNLCASLVSMTRLRQAPANVYTPLSDIEAFVAVMPGVSVISHCRWLYAMACDTISRLLPAVRVGLMECLPDDDAAIACRRGQNEF